MQDPFRLDGRLALVTGGGTGLGHGVCRAMTEAGARIVMTGRREDVLKAACEQLGGSSAYLRHDVADLPSIPGLVEQVESRFGPLDILVNNAGNHLKKGAVETSDAEFSTVLQTHLFGAYALSRECGRRMLARKRGSILMVVSMASLFGIPMVSAYTAAKAALLGLTRALTVEFSPHGVRVNAIAPGWFDTELNRRAFEGDPGRLQKILSRTPLGRVGEALDVGHAAVYLSSPAAKFVTGVCLPVDGGASIGF
ncbi:MAG TPA: glucose 1-dehydrogenase [Candidatus Methylomirabilis sp.]|nr:glucose 1-dehydrogenase [Candidatus Methylomirabilis sp.]